MHGFPAVNATTASAPVSWIEHGSQAYRRINAALFLAGFATFSLIYCVQPLLPEFATDFRVSPAQSSLALSLTTGFLALAIVCAGVLSEVLGRRLLMFASMIAAAVLNVVEAILPNWGALLVARALEGFVLGGVPAVAMAYLAEEIHPRALGRTMGLYVGGTAIGGLSGRVAGGVLTQLASWRAALGILGAIDLLAALCFLFLLPESRNFVRRQGFEMQYNLRAWSGHLRHRGLPFLFLIGGTAMGAFVTIYNYVGFLLKAAPFDLNQTEIGFIFVVYAFGIVASSVAGSLADRIGHGPVLVAGLLIELLGVGLTLLHALTGVIVGVMALTIGFFVAHSVASGWVGRMAGTAKGHASSLYLFAYYAGSSVMGSVGGWFWATGGWPPVACFTAVLLLVGLGTGLQLRRLERRG